MIEKYILTKPRIEAGQLISVQTLIAHKIKLESTQHWLKDQLKQLILNG